MIKRYSNDEFKLSLILYFNYMQKIVWTILTNIYE